MTSKNHSIPSFGKSIRKFNPGTSQTDQEVVNQFLVRNSEFETILDVLRGNVELNSCQHMLIVAPRGQGKTMLLARTAAELRMNNELSQSLLPVRFMEESHEIFNVFDFWLETLFQLEKAIENDSPAMALELKETYKNLSSRWSEQGIDQLALAKIMEIANWLGKKLVLMIENLQSICSNVDHDFGWKLRAVLQTEPQIILLSSATNHFQRLDDPSEPFFELFREIQLKPLNTEACCRLWGQLSDHPVNQAAVRPLEILTGGNPRLMVMVAEFVGHQSLRKIMEEMVMLVDEHSEYFRNHLDRLSKSERRVYVALLDLWRPSSTSEIAARARMDIRVVSTLLRRLIDQSAVMLDSSGTKHRRLYVAAEPLYSIYYKFRREHNEAAVVANLIRFMIAFYGETDSRGVSQQLLVEAQDSPTVLKGINLVLGDLPKDVSHDSSFPRDALQQISERAMAHHEQKAENRFLEQIDSASKAEDWQQVLEISNAYFGSRHPSSAFEIEDDMILHATYQIDAYYAMKEFDRLIEIATETIEQLRSTNM